MNRWARASISLTVLLCGAGCSPNKSSDTVISPPPTTANAPTAIAKRVVVPCSGAGCKNTRPDGCHGSDVDAQTRVRVIDTNTRHILDELALGPGHAGASNTCFFTLRTSIATTTPEVDLVVGSRPPLMISVADLKSATPLTLG